MKFDMRQNLTTLFGFIPNLFLKNLVKKLGSFQTKRNWRVFWVMKHIY